MAEITDEEKIMLVELLRKTGLNIHLVTCGLKRCTHNQDGACNSEYEVLDIDDNGGCISYVPGW